MSQLPFQLIAIDAGRSIVLATLSVRRARALREARCLAVHYLGVELYVEPYAAERLPGAVAPVRWRVDKDQNATI